MIGEPRPGRPRHARWACAGAVGACALLGRPAQAQAPAVAPASPPQPEVVVTAERRGADIQRTPIAVTALSAKTLDQGFVTDIEGLNSLAPGLQTTKAAGFEGLVAIRGVGSGTPENSLVTSPGVSLFVDGVYIANTISIDQALFDVKSIEVLRGPQGALYGQSSIGGAINIVTNAPRLGVFDASGDVSVGSHSLFRERAEVNLPLGDRFALRLSGQRFDHDGFTTNTYLHQDLDDAHNGSVKAALLWRPRDDLTVTATAQYYNDDRNGDAQKNILDPTPDPRQLQQDLPAAFDLTTQLYSVKVEWALPWATLRSITAFQGLDHEQQLDSDRSIYPVIGGYDHLVAWNTHLHDYTEDLELISKPGRFEWILGFFDLYQGGKQFVVEYGGVFAPDFSQSAPPDSVPPDVLTDKPPYLNYGNLSEVRRRSHSFFGQAVYHVTPKFRITAGARSNNDYFRDISINAGAVGSVSLPPIVNRTDVPTWRLVGEYDLTPEAMLYASYTRGYKPGGVNGSNLAAIPLTFQPETNTAYEIGAKTFFFDRTLRLNLAAYSYIHRNFQFVETDPQPFNSGIANVPRIHDYGLELETEYATYDGRLHVGGDLALETGSVSTDAYALNSTAVASLYGLGIQGFPGVPGTPCANGAAYGAGDACQKAVLALASDLKGDAPPADPNVSGSVHASYRFDAYGGSLTPRLEVVYRGDEWARIFNQPGIDRIRSYAILNANLAYAPDRSRWRASLTLTNLLDSDGVNARYTDPYGTFQTSEQLIPPRQIIGTIAFSF